MLWAVTCRQQSFRNENSIFSTLSLSLYFDITPYIATKNFSYSLPIVLVLLIVVYELDFISVQFCRLFSIHFSRFVFILQCTSDDTTSIADTEELGTLMDILLDAMCMCVFFLYVQCFQYAWKPLPSETIYCGRIGDTAHISSLSSKNEYERVKKISSIATNFKAYRIINSEEEKKLTFAAILWSTEIHFGL